MRKLDIKFVTIHVEKCDVLFFQLQLGTYMNRYNNMRRLDICNNIHVNCVEFHSDDMSNNCGTIFTSHNSCMHIAHAAIYTCTATATATDYIVSRVLDSIYIYIYIYDHH